MRRWVAWDQPFYDYPARPSMPGLLGLAWRHWPGYWVRLADDVAEKRHRRMWKHKASKGRRRAAFVVSGSGK